MLNDLFQISKITSDDLEELREISLDTFYQSFNSDNTEENMQLYMSEYFSYSNLNSEINNKDSEFYFIHVDEQIAGYLKINAGNAQTDLKEDNGLEIERIYIKKEFQGKKIGQLLFDKALEIAGSKHADFLWLGVWEKNLGAIKFYERNGMVKFASHHFKLGDDIQIDFLMRLNLK